MSTFLAVQMWSDWVQGEWRACTVHQHEARTVFRRRLQFSVNSHWVSASRSRQGGFQQCTCWLHVSEVTTDASTIGNWEQQQPATAVIEHSLSAASGNHKHIHLFTTQCLLYSKFYHQSNMSEDFRSVAWKASHWHFELTRTKSDWAGLWSHVGLVMP